METKDSRVHRVPMDVGDPDAVRNSPMDTMLFDGGGEDSNSNKTVAAAAVAASDPISSKDEAKPMNQRRAHVREDSSCNSRHSDLRTERTERKKSSSLSSSSYIRVFPIHREHKAIPLLTMTSAMATATKTTRATTPDSTLLVAPDYAVTNLLPLRMPPNAEEEPDCKDRRVVLQSHYFIFISVASTFFPLHSPKFIRKLRRLISSILSLRNDTI